jgi:voltage-gated potassium channel
MLESAMNNPEHRARDRRIDPRGWTSLLIGITLLLSFSLPLEQMAYHAELQHPLLLGIRWLGYLLFLIDLVRRARRGEYRRGAEDSWHLVPDLLAALPLGPLAFVALPGAPPWFASLLHLLPILRLGRVYLAAREWQQASPGSTGWRRIGTTLVAIALLIHWVGCWQLAVYDTVEGHSFAMHYLQALYWTVTTMTTIGYGDITPDKSQPVQLLFTMGIMAIGAGVFGFVIGNIATIMANIDFARNQHLDRMQRITTFLQYNRIPAHLSGRIHDYFAYVWRTRKGFNEAEILDALPAALRRDVEMHLRRDIVAKVPFFRGADNLMLGAIVSRLHPCVALPDERIIRRGEIGSAMYFIAAGSVDVLGPDDATPVATLSDGSFFGEIALLEHCPRGADVRAADFCDLYRLEKADLDEVMAQYPAFGEHVRAMAAARKAPKP